MSVRTRASDGGIYFLKSNQSSRVSTLKKSRGSMKTPKHLWNKARVHAWTGLNVRFGCRPLERGGWGFYLSAADYRAGSPGRLAKKRETWTGPESLSELKPCFEPQTAPTSNDEHSDAAVVSLTTWQVDLLTLSHICCLRQQTHDALAMRKIQTPS